MTRFQNTAASSKEGVIFSNEHLHKYPQPRRGARAVGTRAGATGVSAAVLPFARGPAQRMLWLLSAFLLTSWQLWRAAREGLM